MTVMALPARWIGCGVRVAVTTMSGDVVDWARAVVVDAIRSAAAERRLLAVDMRPLFRPTGGDSGCT
jgi:hypothetical protein